MNLYVYFRSARDDRAVVESALQALMRELRREQSVQCELLLRSDAQALYLTWMEVYTDVPSDQLERFQAHLADCFKRHGLTRLIQGGRQFETFERRLESDAATSRANH